MAFQSPSRGGELRCLMARQRELRCKHRFSPLRAGENFAAGRKIPSGSRNCQFQSPSRGGELRCSARATIPPTATPFQSPSRGGELRCGIKAGSGIEAGSFQSPSRGGELRCPRGDHWGCRNHRVSVPFARGRTSLRPLFFIWGRFYACFSPLRAGENFAATNTNIITVSGIQVSVPFARGRTSLQENSIGSVFAACVSVPFARGRTSLPGRCDTRRWRDCVSVPFARGRTSLLVSGWGCCAWPFVSVPFARGRTSLRAYTCE